MKQRQVLTTDDGQPPCVHVVRVIARRLAEVEAGLAELARAHDQLAALAVRAARAGRGRLPRLLLGVRWLTQASACRLDLPLDGKV